MGQFITQLCTVLRRACCFPLLHFCCWWCCFDLQERFEPARAELTETEALQSADSAAQKPSPSPCSAWCSRLTPQQGVPIKSYNATSTSVCSCSPKPVVDPALSGREKIMVTMSRESEVNII